MKQIQELIKATQVLRVEGNSDTRVSRLAYDSRRIAPGDCFFAVSGTQSDGHAYIDAAVTAGAAAVVCQRLPEHLAPSVCYVVVADTNAAMADMAAAFYGDPSRQLKLVGITGTNGKTTTVTLLYDLFRGLGYKVGLISTVVYRIDTERIESTHTTPDAIRLNEMMARMVEAGCEYCFMEVSSHAIVQERIRGLHFTGGIFSNITHDHLDYHKTFAEYIRAKKLFFDNLPKEAFALINIDDRNGRVMVQNTRATVKTLSLQSMADFRCKILETHPDGMELRIDGREVWVHFLGRFNAYNLLCVYAAALLLGADREEVLQIMSTLHPVSGRFEFVRAADGTTAIVDYAHTPDALEKVLQTVEEIRRPGQQLFVLCGCGGDRDRGKRPKMGRIAGQKADFVIVTSDNPRTEDPEAIIADILPGLKETRTPYVVRPDRREAIAYAIENHCPGDVIILCGKGHEDYQIIGKTKVHMDEREIVAEILEKRKREK